jgi:hypothetical protein
MTKKLHSSIEKDHYNEGCTIHHNNRTWKATHFDGRISYVKAKSLNEASDKLFKREKSITWSILEPKTPISPFDKETLRVKKRNHARQRGEYHD